MEITICLFFHMMFYCDFFHLCIATLGAIQVLRNADGGGGVSDFLEKSVTKV